MNNFTDSSLGYDKSEVNSFVDYVIKKTEENIDLIKSQKEEIERLTKELNNYRKIENRFDYLTQQAERNSFESKELAKKQAELIINEAKDNANRIINDCLIRSAKMEEKREFLNKNIYNYKKKLKQIAIEQLNSLEDIEML